MHSSGKLKYVGKQKHNKAKTVQYKTPTAFKFQTNCLIIHPQMQKQIILY